MHSHEKLVIEICWHNIPFYVMLENLEISVKFQWTFSVGNSKNQTSFYAEVTEKKIYGQKKNLYVLLYGHVCLMLRQTSEGAYILRFSKRSS